MKDRHEVMGIMWYTGIRDVWMANEKLEEIREDCPALLQKIMASYERELLARAGF